MGSYSWDENSKPEGFAKDFTEGYKKYFPQIWISLFSNTIFKKAFAERWKYLRTSKLSDELIKTEILKLHQETYKDVIFENAIKYRKYSDEKELEFLLDWIQKRLDWLDENIEKY
jgi:hypothetical protein